MQDTAAAQPIGVLGMGSCLPDTVRTNTEIAERIGVTSEWITKRTGIHQRHVCAPGENASDLAARAVRDALDSAGLAADELDLLVLATTTPDELGASTACRVQSRLGARNAVALDVGAACSGWLLATRVATDWLRAGTGERYAAVVGVEVFSPVTDPTDRGTAVLFGDGCAAGVFGPVPEGEGFGTVTLGSDGTLADHVPPPAKGSRRPTTPRTGADGGHYLRTEGRAVRDFTLDALPRTAHRTLRLAGLTVDDIDLVVAHQPDPALLRLACDEAGLDTDRVVVTADRVGNIGAASVPYTLERAHATGRLRRGDRALILAFGAGMTWGGTVLTWSGIRHGGRSATAPEGRTALSPAAVTR